MFFYRFGRVPIVWRSLSLFSLVCMLLLVSNVLWYLLGLFVYGLTSRRFFCFSFFCSFFRFPVPPAGRVGDWLLSVRLRGPPMSRNARHLLPYALFPSARHKGPVYLLLQLQTVAGWPLSDLSSLFVAPYGGGISRTKVRESSTHYTD